MKLKAKANGSLGPSSLLLPPSLLTLFSRDEQAGTESPPHTHLPSLAGMLVTLHVADFCGEAHCSEMHEVVGGQGSWGKGVYAGGVTRFWIIEQVCAEGCGGHSEPVALCCKGCNGMAGTGREKCYFRKL